jgi:tripartite-type tricarboxylate transporter receptor subunit TctC
MEPFALTPEQVNALLKADIVKYARIIKAANIRME